MALLKRISFWFIFLTLPFTLNFAAVPQTFSSAKKIAFNLFEPHKMTLYCGCKYDSDKNVDLISCSMNAATSIARAHRIEWEHMMPAEHFGRSHSCWTEKICTNKKTGKAYKGRKCCEKSDPEFRLQEAELYNLWPAVGSVNQERSNYNFGLLVNKRGFYGCEFEADKERRIAEPPDRAKGIIARANLFMADKYKVELGEQKELFLKWNKQFPPDFWELSWAAEVAAIVGYDNPYIKSEAVG